MWTWPEAVDQALCFGWIDGVRKSIDAHSYCIRFTPRKPKSIWSRINVKRVQELSELGLMQAAGLRVFNERDQTKTKLHAYENAPAKLTHEDEQKLRDKEKAWRFFQAQAPSYRRVCISWVVRAKQEDTRRRRLAILIEDSAKGQLSATFRWRQHRKR